MVIYYSTFFFSLRVYSVDLPLLPIFLILFQMIRSIWNITKGQCTALIGMSCVNLVVSCRLPVPRGELDTDV